jgi:DNA polymerase-3 subunit beta
MKLEIDRSELLNAVSIAIKAVASKTTRPILANVLIEAKNDRVRFVGTDFEQMMIAECAASIDKEGSIAVPARLMQDIISSMPSGDLFPIQLEVQDGKLYIGGGKSKFSVYCLDAEDFPPVPDVDAEFTQINGHELSQAIKQAGIAASVEDGNPVQKSVLLDFVENIHLVATDSKRLSVKQLDKMQVADELKKQFIVPIKAANEAAAMFDKCSDAEIGVYKEQLVFKRDGVMMLSRLVDGKFPAYHRVMPKESSFTAKAYRKELGQAIKTLLPIAKNSNFLIWLDFGHDEIKMWSESKENGKAETAIGCKTSGEPIKIGFNAKFLQDFIAAADVEEITIGMTTPSYPALFTAGDDDKFQTVIMPMSF